jgi:hypothetical protein
MQYLYEILMNGDLHSVILLAENVCNVDHIMGCLIYCLHEGKDKMSPAVPDGKRKNSYPVHYHLLHSVKCCVLTTCMTGDYDDRDYENYHVKECYPMWSVRNLLTFQGNVSDPSSS